jgi:hypothetical protein
MKRISKTMLGVALVLFGALSQAAPSSAAVSYYDCSGRAEPLCTTKKSEACVRETICGIGAGPFNVPYLITCCAEWEITTEYTYYNSR